MGYSLSDYTTGRYIFNEVDDAVYFGALGYLFLYLFHCIAYVVSAVVDKTVGVVYVVDCLVAESSADADSTKTSPPT